VSAASRNNTASAPTALSRSSLLKPPSFGASSGMLSCWGSLDCSGDIGNGFTASLLSDDEIAMGSSPESLLGEKVMQGNKGG